MLYCTLSTFIVFELLDLCQGLPDQTIPCCDNVVCTSLIALCVLLLFSHFSFTNFERESIADHDCVRNSSYLPCYYNFTTTTKTIFTHKKLKRSYGYYLYYANSYASRQILLQGGDIETKPGPNASDINLKTIKVTPPTVRNSSIPLCLINAQSIRNKTVDLVDYVYENKFDLHFQ